MEWNTVLSTISIIVFFVIMMRGCGRMMGGGCGMGHRHRQPDANPTPSPDPAAPRLGRGEHG